MTDFILKLRSHLCSLPFHRVILGGPNLGGNVINFTEGGQNKWHTSEIAAGPRRHSSNDAVSAHVAARTSTEVDSETNLQPFPISEMCVCLHAFKVNNTFRIPCVGKSPMQSMSTVSS